ncbi:acetyltransferase [Brevibacillus sp. 179-C 1.1 NHS]|uniref:acetyltransferase n=1 Tax=Brevibacillus sp. 179-C 1.1 NHS TaxID=3235177 RepID=UPI00399F1018
MEKVIIFGLGQIAEIAHFYLMEDSPYEVVAFTVDKKYMNKEEFKELPVVPFEEIEMHFPPNEYKLFIPISYTQLNKLRAEKYYEGKKKGYTFISYISSKATYYNTPIGENCFILENNVIQPFTKIGDNVIMWSGNHIGHHSTIEDHCFLASHIVISGSVLIKPYSFIGVNATFRDNITVGAENIIGAGALILTDTLDGSVYPGKKTEKFHKTSDQIRL